MAYVPNNEDKVAKTINEMRLTGVEAVGDDGRVCIQIRGTRNHVAEMAEIINNSKLPTRVGDGVQEGGYWVNGTDCDFHDELVMAL